MDEEERQAWAAEQEISSSEDLYEAWVDYCRNECGRYLDELIKLLESIVENRKFSEAVRGITAARIGEITGKSTSIINAYLQGRAPIPFEVEKIAQQIKTFFDQITVKDKKLARSLKKVIDGKLYNTETATMIAEYWNGKSNSDFNHISEELYRTKNRNFFLAGNGGAMTKYSISCGSNSTCGSEKIIPITEAEARSWLEKYSDAETYVAAFGAPPEA